MRLDVGLAMLLAALLRSALGRHPQRRSLPHCFNGGTVRRDVCVCLAGFVGERCEHDRCGANGRFDDKSGACVCVEPWNGAECSRLCKNAHADKCECHDGYSGDKCDEFGPCLHEGTFSDTAPHPRKCTCRPEWQGVLCETRPARCANGSSAARAADALTAAQGGACEPALSSWARTVMVWMSVVGMSLIITFIMVSVLCVVCIICCTKARTIAGGHTVAPPRHDLGPNSWMQETRQLIRPPAFREQFPDTHLPPGDIGPAVALRRL